MPKQTRKVGDTYGLPPDIRDDEVAMRLVGLIRNAAKASGRPPVGLDSDGEPTYRFTKAFHSLYRLHGGTGTTSPRDLALAALRELAVTP